MMHPWDSKSWSNKAFFGLWLAGVLASGILGMAISRFFGGFPEVLSTDGGWLVATCIFAIYWMLIFSTDREWI